MERLCVLTALLCALCARSSAGTPHQSPEQNEEPEDRDSILSELLAAHDEVKAFSEGSDCRCKCVVRPLSRSACRRLEEEGGTAAASDFYTVETITSGPECKCTCVAPPAAVNPCEGELRLKQLREAAKQNVKLLDGSLYRMDLLKLHSVTNKLMDRMDRIEKLIRPPEQVASLNNVEDETPPTPAAGPEAPPPSLHSEEEGLGEVIRAAAFLNPEEKHDGKSAVENSPTDPQNAGEIGAEAPPETRGNSDAPPAGKTTANGMIIRGMTFYKSDQDAMAADDGEPGENFFEYHEFSGAGPTSLFMEENLLLQRPPRPRTGSGWRSLKLKAAGHVEDSRMIRPKPEPSSERPPTAQNDGITASETQRVDFTRSGGAEENPASPPPTPPNQAWRTPKATPTAKNSSSRPLAPTWPTSAPEPLTTLPQTDPPAAQTSSTFSPDSRTEAPPTLRTAAVVRHKYKIKWEEDEEEDLHADEQQMHQKTTSRKAGGCKDTLAAISEPVTRNTYGRAEGAWMKDPQSSTEKIYVTNFYYGNNLLEFLNLEVFQRGRPTNSYKLPYNWIGTGHVVYGGAFYYNRAFSRDIIKFDLRRRQVAAWTLLHDALLEESSSPWEWRSHLDFTVDESGLWVIYPAMDDEGFLQEVVVLSRLDPADLSVRKETTWRTGLRTSSFGNCFVVCGVLYAVDSHNHRDANLEYAFDTHTGTQMTPRMPFINNYTYTTQLDYNPREGLLYGWDNGHQVTYSIRFAFVDP